jgi:xanthine dehydrogenase accessory factor
MFNTRVVIRGGGDLGSGVALRLWRCGFPVMILETAQPFAVRRSVAFGEAVYEGIWRVEEAVARRVADVKEALEVSGAGDIPVLVDPTGSTLPDLAAPALVDAIMAKRNTGTSRNMAALVVGLGPGFSAGTDVDAVIETNRGPRLGRVLWDGSADPNTGRPGPVAGKASERVLRAPASGAIGVQVRIGSIVEKDAPLAAVNGFTVRAPFRGLVRGMLRDGLEVSAGMKIGDIDPRTDVSCDLVSDKALAIAGGVIEAILSWRRSEER